MGTKTAVSSANIFMSYSETQSLNQTVTFFEEANSHHPTIKFTTKIHWDNVFRHSCIQRYKIQQKSYPWCKDHGNLPAHILPLVTHRFVKRVWGKCFKIQKNAWWLMMDRGYQHSLKEKLQSEINEAHGNRRPRSWNKTARKKKKCYFSWQNTSPYYCKRSFNGKVESHTKPTATLLFF